ncbi:ureidoglycolate lyase [Frigidibacter sp. RF13]|uniref:ureidoglycolate lyase n=1 Tax=Frigidibacter sp. RF13 TaxID=2997340 RepID=UPI00226E2864|nr:ureidoglycolate lyase [Frigidibacter sp. RF13]MCY1126609.1 ureidoglycolate lyase [Frigidibacter sp. RF13]
MTETIAAWPLTAEAFAPFGEVLEVSGPPTKLINAGKCGRWHDRALLDFADSRAGISIFQSECFALPHDFDLVERHPEGSQAFIPMSDDPFLVIVAPDEGGRPGDPLAFLTTGAQGVNIHRNVWHGVLTPLGGPGLFAVVDRIGTTPNLEEFRYPEPFRVTA